MAQHNSNRLFGRGLLTVLLLSLPLAAQGAEHLRRQSESIPRKSRYDPKFKLEESASSYDALNTRTAEICCVFASTVWMDFGREPGFTSSTSTINITYGTITQYFDQSGNGSATLVSLATLATYTANASATSEAPELNLVSCETLIPAVFATVPTESSCTNYTRILTSPSYHIAVNTLYDTTSVTSTLGGPSPPSTSSEAATITASKGAPSSSITEVNILPTSASASSSPSATPAKGSSSSTSSNTDSETSASGTLVTEGSSNAQSPSASISSTADTISGSSSASGNAAHHNTDSVTQPQPSPTGTSPQFPTRISIHSSSTTLECTVGSQVLSPGGSPVTAGGTTYSLDAHGTALVNGRITTLAVASGGPSASPAITVGSATLTQTSGSEYVISSAQTLSPGGTAITVDGTTYSLATFGSALVVNGVTTPLPAASGSGSESANSALVVGSMTLTANSAAEYIYSAAQTLSPGGTVIVASDATYSLAPSGTALVVASGTALTTDDIGGAIMSGLGATSASESGTLNGTAISTPEAYTGGARGQAKMAVVWLLSVVAAVRFT